MTSTSALQPFAEAIDAQDWDALGRLLTPDFHGLFVHTGQRFDAEGFVDFQRSYPGRWRFAIVDHVQAGDRAVTRSRVTDGAQTFYVATFTTLREGLVADLVEVWTDAVTGPEGTR